MSRWQPNKKECDICHCTDSSKYYKWSKEDEYAGKILCNRHYLQLRNHGRFLDTENIECKDREYWTEKEKKELEKYYKDNLSFEDISKKMNRSIGSINAMSSILKLGDKYMRSNNPKFTAVYQNYDWCFDRFINKGMTHQEMADECGASLRVIQKWCVEKHKIDANTFKKLKKINNLQRQVILFGTLGDGHIDKRASQPLYIESHAIDEKDYLFWKYFILKDLCNQVPTYYQASKSDFGTNQLYDCKPFYRFNTRIINDLIHIRSMKRIDKIKELNEFGLSLHILDDGTRGNLWNHCLAEYTQEEIDLYLKICKERFNLNAKQQKDKRYISFDAVSSKKIDEIILRNIPNDLDIIKKKITNNNHIKELANYVFVKSNNSKIGISTYLRNTGIDYSRIRDTLISKNKYEISEDDLWNLISEEKFNDLQQLSQT